MRFRIRLNRTGRERYLPINYQYELSAAIYKIIDRADSEFSEFLHSQGYLAFGKQFRLFTFSRLDFRGYKVIREASRIEHYGEEAAFEISFLVDRAAEEFIKGLFLAQELFIGDKISRIAYRVSHIEAVAPPVFRETMSYRCLSPIFARRKREDGGEDYLHPGDTGYEALLLQNLISKSRAFALAENPSGNLQEDAPQLKLLPRGKVYKNGVRIKQLTQSESMLIGYMYEFELTAPAELQEVGYYAGFGHLGSQGFGCVGVKEA
jgi:CRISPR-associated endoribonuclease Cas6